MRESFSISKPLLTARLRRSRTKMAISADVLRSYRSIDEKVVDKLLAQEIKNNNKKIVVLDDDPTGVQTVHDISVYTGWDADSLREAFAEENNLFYILTNSRGLLRHRRR